MLHSAGRVVNAGAPTRRAWSAQEVSCPDAAPRRPRTTQTARTVSLPSLLSRWGVGDGKVIESPGPRMNSSNPTIDAQRPAEDVSELVAAVAAERVVGAGRAARRVGRLDELDVLVRPEHQPLPRDTGAERDGRSPLGALHREPGPGHRRGPSRTADADPSGSGSWSNSTSSMVTPNSATNAYSVRTEGCILPVSICEIELGESSSRARELAQAEPAPESDRAQPRSERRRRCGRDLRRRRLDSRRCRFACHTSVVRYGVAVTTIDGFHGRAVSTELTVARLRAARRDAPGCR